MSKSMGYFYAILAALLNGFIGIFSVKIIQIGLPPYAVSFYKCFLALVMITCVLIATNQFSQWLLYFKTNWKKVSLCAFFGFFMLYFFETTAYKYTKVPLVVFLLLGVATITTFILKGIFNKRFLNRSEAISCIFAVIGLILLFDVKHLHNQNILGILCAVIAGIGYGLFLTFSSRLKIGSGLIVVNTLMLFGCVYLFVPFIIGGAQGIPNLISLIYLIALAIFPTIGGFWCTTKALSILSSESVQLLELTEPIFSILLAWIILSQKLNFIQLLGSTLVLIAICINMYRAK
jgi:drug/metabolite transporter (DMT)-like permease